MDITILKNPEKFLFDNRLRWELFAKKSRGAIIVIGLCGIVILVIAWIYAKEGENFLGPVSSIGLSFILLCLIYIFQLYQNKQKFLRETSVYVSKLKKLGSETVIKINEDHVSYRDSERFLEYKWSFFSEYRLYKDHLFLTTNDFMLNAMIIGKDETNPTDFSLLVEFAQKRLKERK